MAAITLHALALPLPYMAHDMPAWLCCSAAMRRREVSLMPEVALELATCRAAAHPSLRSAPPPSASLSHHTSLFFLSWRGRRTGVGTKRACLSFTGTWRCLSRILFPRLRLPTTCHGTTTCLRPFALSLRTSVHTCLRTTPKPPQRHTAMQKFLPPYCVRHHAHLAPRTAAYPMPTTPRYCNTHPTALPCLSHTHLHLPPFTAMGHAVSYVATYTTLFPTHHTHDSATLPALPPLPTFCHLAVSR